MTMTSVLEDYLKIILELNEKEGIVRVTDVADRLNVAKSTVCITVNKLKAMGLVTKERYGTLQLTAIGQDQAIKVRSRHMIIKEFLIRILGVDDYASEKEACQMEHIVGEQTIEKLEAFLVSNKL